MPVATACSRSCGSCGSCGICDGPLTCCVVGVVFIACPSWRLGIFHFPLSNKADIAFEQPAALKLRSRKEHHRDSLAINGLDRFLLAIKAIRDHVARPRPVPAEIGHNLARLKHAVPQCLTLIIVSPSITS